MPTKKYIRGQPDIRGKVNNVEHLFNLKRRIKKHKVNKLKTKEKMEKKMEKKSKIEESSKVLNVKVSLSRYTGILLI